MTTEAWLAVVHLAATAAMVGLIWTIHAVHYPLFGLVGPERYAEFQREHMRRITRVLLVPWGVEGLSSLALVALTDGTDRRWSLAGLVLLAGVVAVTGLGAAPIHGRLTNGFEPELHRRLMRFDAVRAIGWTARLVVAIVLVARLTERPIG
ncbi:MAG: hypothetical protein R2733_26630 [Acidimicrobiales bacterium]